MRPWIFTLLLCFASVPALAGPKDVVELNGRVCVEDANTLYVGGMRRKQGCEGGDPVRLRGADAPDLDQSCTSLDGREWYCGRAAAANLLELVKNQDIRCQGTEKDRHGRLLAVCWKGKMDIAREMVRLGWAMADREERTYRTEESNAHIAALGLWQGKFDDPTDWRLRRGRR